MRLHPYINIKFPVSLLDIVDENVKEGKVLRKAGFEKSSHFIQEAVIEKLEAFNLITQQEANQIIPGRIKHRYHTKIDTSF